MTVSVQRVSMETEDELNICQTTTEGAPLPSPPPPTSFILSTKLGGKNAGQCFFEGTSLMTLRWEGRRDTFHSSLFFGKSGGGANNPSQNPRLHCSLG